MATVKRLFGARLKQLREEQGLRVDDVAGWVGVDRTHIYGLERGDVWPSIDLAISLATVYRVDPADLFTFPESHPRHLLRDRIRQVPNAKLAALSELVAQFLADAATTSATVAVAPRRKAK